MQTKKEYSNKEFSFFRYKKINFLHFTQKNEMNLISFFRKIVEINTYSYNLDGIYNCLEILANNVPTSLNIEQKNRNLVISNVSKNYILLMGHIDTVFPEDLGFNKFLESKEKNLWAWGI